MPTIHDRFGRFVVVSSAAHMPSRCKGTYRRVAVIDTLVDFAAPKPIEAIRNIAGIQKIVHTWEARNVGRTERSAFAEAVAEATEMARKLWLDRVPT